jgi:hypothetical protein
MADGPPDLPVTLTFTGLAGEADVAPPPPTVMPRAAGEVLRDFFEAHPSVEFVQFQVALNEDGDDLEYAGGTLHAEGGALLRDGRDASRAGDALRRLLRTDPHLAALPVALVIATGGIEHTFRIMRDATGAARPAGEPSDPDVRAAARERARLEARDARFDQRDELPGDDDHAA